MRSSGSSAKASYCFLSGQSMRACHLVKGDFLLERLWPRSVPNGGRIVWVGVFHLPLRLLLWIHPGIEITERWPIFKERLGGFKEGMGVDNHLATVLTP